MFEFKQLYYEFCLSVKVVCNTKLTKNIMQVGILLE